MKKRFVGMISILVLAVLLVLFGAGFSESRASAPKYKSTFYSDLGNFWFLNFMKSSWPSGELPDAIWYPDNVQFKDGKMVLSIDRVKGYLTAGEVRTYKTFGYGYYQTRMKPISHNGVVSAFFNYARDDATGKSTEIDIEFLGSDTTKVQFNYHTDGVGGHEYLYDLGFDASKEYHDYAFYWTSDAIYWYVDGVLAYEVHASDIPTIEASINMDVWASGKESWLGNYDGATPLYAYYDWVSYSRPEDMK